MNNDTLIIVSIIATASLVITEVLLILTMRRAVKELQMIRREAPRMMGAGMALNLLLAAAQYATHRGVAEPPNGP